MPLYLGHCKKCNKEQDYWSSIANRLDPPNCDLCGEKLEYQFTGNSGGFLLLGSGWPGERIKREREHQKAVNQSPKEFLGGGWKKLK